VVTHLVGVALLLLWGGVMLYFFVSGRVAAYLPPDGIFRPMVLASGIGLLISASSIWRPWAPKIRAVAITIAGMTTIMITITSTAMKAAATITPTRTAAVGMTTMVMPTQAVDMIIRMTITMTTARTNTRMAFWMNPGRWVAPLPS